MTDTLLCPMKFQMVSGGNVTLEDCTCDSKRCAWWVSGYSSGLDSRSRPYGCALRTQAELVQKGYAR